MIAGAVPTSFCPANGVEYLYQPGMKLRLKMHVIPLGGGACVKNTANLLLLICAGFPPLLVAQADHAKQIDAVFEHWNNPDTPGAAVAVIEHGKIVYEKGYGIANLEYNIPIVPQTIFHVASVSKQFTAMAIVLLERDGKLSIDDDVHKYLPELPNYGYKITLRNLLQHTSGIRDQRQTLSTAGWSMEDVITQDQILRMLFRQKELNFQPGTKHDKGKVTALRVGGGRVTAIRFARK
jgi:CubicO group peptidase (beta-lactamase class C family)